MDFDTMMMRARLQEMEREIAQLHRQTASRHKAPRPRTMTSPQRRPVTAARLLRTLRQAL